MFIFAEYVGSLVSATPKELKSSTRIPFLKRFNPFTSGICNELAFCSNILSSISNKKKRELSLLKQSILKQAFSGELVKD